MPLFMIRFRLCISGSGGPLLAHAMRRVSSVGVTADPWAKEVATQSLHRQGNTYRAEGPTRLVFYQTFTFQL